MIPKEHCASATKVLDFNKRIVDITYDLVCAYKVQIAHYAAYGGEPELLETIEYIKSACPRLVVILDAKRADVGTTAMMYAREVFERYGAHAVTVNPYLGLDSLQPFLSRSERGCIILCRTSNPGAADLQDLEVRGQPLYAYIAELVSKKWNTCDNVMLVVGATHPRAISTVRKVAPRLPFLVPGVGAQGGDPAAAVRAGMTMDRYGLVVSASRSVVFAGDDRAIRAESSRLLHMLRDAQAEVMAKNSW